MWCGYSAGHRMMTTSQPGPLFVGVDGGGTGCRARLENAEGCLLGTGIAGPAALRIGIDSAFAEVEKACRAALEDARLGSSALSSVHAGVGLAGVGRKGALEQLTLRPHPFRSVVYAHDATIACIGAHGDRDGAIVIAGTGSNDDGPISVAMRTDAGDRRVVSINDGAEGMRPQRELLERAFAADPSKADTSMHRAQRAGPKPGIFKRCAAGLFHFGKRTIDSYA